MINIPVVKVAMDYFLSSGIYENSYIDRFLNLKLLSSFPLSSSLCFFQLVLRGAVTQINELSTAQASLKNASYCALSMGTNNSEYANNCFNLQ